ncbi:hypothetical protein HT031_004315 [Scenedesmus sp. PABB004]|nr:hypothetical protein HT031_004315 [Scenedesmus sp. PABB004]
MRRRGGGRALLLPLLALAAAAAPQQQQVHVVFGNHLDIGFDNIYRTGYDSNVLNVYFQDYLPRAVDVADWMQRVSPGRDRFVFTTHAYLLSLFLDCPPGMGLACPGPALRAKVLRGVASGAITWHAHPHNAQYELYDASLLSAATALVHGLDARFGLPPKRTVVLRDVPGLTRSAIPLLVASGVRAVSVGVNPGSAPPGVPQFTPFIWRDEASGTQLLAFWRPGGYGGVRENDVNLDPPEQCIQAPGLEHVLCTSWRNDNAGPPLTVLEPLRVYDLLRAEWPGARVAASSFDAFVDAVLAAAPTLNLTVVTGEVGDTWINGVASDPAKTADFRAASRARAACLADPACPSEGAAFANFTRLLLKVPEHTWGVDIKKTLADFVNYSNPDFHACLPPDAASGAAGDGDGGDGVPLRAALCPNYERVLHSWDRQAAYIDWALQALPPAHPVRAAFEADAAERRRLAATSAAGLLAAGASRRRAAGAQPGAGAVAASRRRRLAASPGRGAGSSAEEEEEERRRRREERRRPRSAVGGVTQYTCGSWRFELDEAQGGLSSLVKLHGAARAPGADWAARGGLLGQLRYSAYCEASYDFVWRHYSWQLPLPWWYPLDFGKVNSSAAWDREEHAAAKLEEVLETREPSGALRQLALRHSFPAELVRRVGAPRAAWTLITCPGDDGGSVPGGAPGGGGGGGAAGPRAGDLGLAVVWQGKTATRLPEALWLRFAPGPGGADASSWRLHKLGGAVDPGAVLTNGSQSMHAVGDAGVSVRSADGREALQVLSWDAPLVSPGAANPFPNGAFPPDLGSGVAFNLANNVWGTNYVMWSPYRAARADAALAFRFALRATRVPPIFVKAGATHLFEVGAGATVADVKELVHAREGVPAEGLYAVFNGKPLADSELLSLAGVEEEQTLYILGRLLGGGKKRKKKTYTKPKKQKHKHKKIKLRVLKFYKVDDSGKVSRLRKQCPQCGPGIFMATHFDRVYCGKCATTYLVEQEAKGKGKGKNLPAPVPCSPVPSPALRRGRTIQARSRGSSGAANHRCAFAAIGGIMQGGPHAGPSGAPYPPQDPEKGFAGYAPGGAPAAGAGWAAQPPPPPGYGYAAPGGYPPQGHPQGGYAAHPQGGFAAPPPPAAFGVAQGGMAPPERQRSYGPGNGMQVNLDPDMTTAMAFAETAVRNGFVRKVFGIVGIQLAITVGFAAVCLFNPTIKLYVRTHSWPFYLAWGLAFGLLLVISCVEKARRQFPLNMVLLAAFTFAQAFLVGMITAFYNIEAVMLAFLVTSVAVVSLSLFAINTKLDVTRWTSLLLVGMVAFIVLLLVGIFWINKVLYLVIAGFACLLFSAYLLYDIQMVMGGKRYSLSPDEYVLGALSIYLDIVNLFIWLLAIIGICGNNN